MRNRVFLVIIMIFVTLLFSCSLNQSSVSIIQQQISSIEREKTGEKIFEFSSPEIFFDEDAFAFGYNYAKDKEQWANQIESQFGITLSITSLYDLAAAEKLFAITEEEFVYENIKRNIENGTIKGLFQVGTLGAVEKLAEEGLILPLDPYLEGNSIWDSMPEDCRNSFTLDGLVYGISTCCRTYAYVRYVRKDWLDKFNLDIPSSLNDFYEYMKQFTYDDPDGNNVDDTFAFEYSIPRDASDIFAAFDTRLNPEGNALPNWNPNTGFWEDSMIKPEMKDCLEFLEACYMEGLIRKRDDQGDIQFYMGNAASYYMSLRAGYSIQSELTKITFNNQAPEIGYIVGLTHNSDKNLNGYYTRYLWPNVLTKNSTSPDTTVRIFMNVFIGDETGFKMGAFGTEGTGYATVDNKAIVKTIEHDGFRFMYCGPKIMQKDPLKRVTKIKDTTYNSIDYSELTAYWEECEIRDNDFLKSSLTYKVPLGVLNPKFTTKQEEQFRELRDLTSLLIEKAIFGEISYEQALKEYRKKARQTGLEKFIEEQNGEIN